jgi:hypothetical protein
VSELYDLYRLDLDLGLWMAQANDRSQLGGTASGGFRESRKSKAVVGSFRGF